MTHYTPILDAKGRVIGATVIGIDLGERLANLKTELRSAKIGSSGYYYIVNATPGAEFGRLILHPYKEDQKIELVDRDGKNLTAEMGAQRSGEITYFWQNIEAGETAQREKRVIFETLDNPKWVIAGGSTIEEFTALPRQIVWLVLTGGLVMAAAIFIVILSLVRNFILQPLRKQVLPTLHKMSAGNFESRLDIRDNDEIGKFVQGLECMQTRLAFESERERSLSIMRESARKEAESLSQARAEFLANMSHEIRTPLNAVIGLAYLLEQSKLSPRDLEYVRRIEGAGKLLLAVVNDVLDFSKIDADRGCPFPPRRCTGQSLQLGPHSRPGKGPGPRIRRLARGPAGAAWRCAASISGADQPGQQCRQVHRRGLGHRFRKRQTARRRASRAGIRHSGYRHRNVGRAIEQPVPGILARR
jgi:hypothetical protein